MKDDIKRQMEKRICGRTFTDEERLQWLTEDETATYDRIVSQRKRRAMMRRWTAVAAVAIIFISLGVVLLGNSGDTHLQYALDTPDTAIGNNNVRNIAEAEPATTGIEAGNVRGGKEHDGNAVDRGTARAKARRLVKTTKPDDGEELSEVLARLNSRMDFIDDSIEVTHIKHYIDNNENMYYIRNEVLSQNNIADNNNVNEIIR